MMTTTEAFLQTKESAPTKDLPEIPKELVPLLKKAYARYEHLILIEFGEFEQSEIEKDRQKYPHLLFPEENGLPAFKRESCLEYMHLKSGISKVYCAVQMYHEYIDSVAAGYVLGEARENLENEYSLTLDLIEKARGNSQN